MKKIESILIANRGEIASRIIRTCKRLGIRSIAVFSEADQAAPFVAEADLAVALGGNTPAESYLDSGKILRAAQKVGAQAIHPGYGFLSENAEFAAACEAAGCIWIGPHPAAIAAMGSKSEAKALMRSHGVPVVPGFEGDSESTADLQAEANKVGYPLLLKAVAGGGGKGMRIVHSANEFEAALAAAQSEALAAFGNGQMILERYFPEVRHVEFQIMGDQHGHAIHLLERECTIQRRYQKVIEESPSPVLFEGLRAQMGEAAVRAAKALRYDNAGTVEFILTGSGEFYFLEVNTRLQVEHPVTEMITGLDLVELQIRSAEGRVLPIEQAQVHAKGYAIECRLYAEDAERNYMPDTGTVLRWEMPKVDGLRVDTGVVEGSVVSTFYDPMLAKLIVWGEDRPTALQKMAYVLQEMVCLGLKTNRAFLLGLLRDPLFIEGKYNTHFLQTWKPGAPVSQEHGVFAAIAATLAAWHTRESARTLLRSLPSGWRNSYSLPQSVSYKLGDDLLRLDYRFLQGVFHVSCQGVDVQAKLVSREGTRLRVEIGDVQHTFEVVEGGNGNIWVQSEGEQALLHLQARFPDKKSAQGAAGYNAPMPSQVLRVLVAAGAQVEAGTGLVVLSSMKMEHTIVAESAGRVLEVLVEAGQNISSGAQLLTFEAMEVSVQ
jgi:acetyl/propionyl-CoA carboxylase alpha subunit